MEERKCRVCGCTEERACEPNGCYWVGDDLCSECVRKNPKAATSEELVYYKKLEGKT